MYYFSKAANQINDEDYQKINIATNILVDETTHVFRNNNIKDCDGANRKKK